MVKLGCERFEPVMIRSHPLETCLRGTLQS